MFELQNGVEVGQRYRIDEYLGAGSYGITYLVFDKILGSEYALKECFPHVLVYRDAQSQCVMPLPGKDEEYEKYKKTFQREARILASLGHISNVVHVHNLIETNNTWYIVMEYLEGPTLSQYLNDNGPVEPVWLMEKVKPLLNALNEVHRKKLLHRDIAPDNIKYQNNQSFVLFDFGAAMPQDKTVTLAIGKPGFAPFEQYKAEPLTPSADIYALSATLYHMLTGVVPPPAPDRMGDIFIGAEDPLKRISSYRDDVPVKLEEMILKGLQLRKEDRYQSAEEMASTIESCLKERNQSYLIEYYYDGLLDAGLTSHGTAPIGSRVDVFPERAKPDYALSGAENLPLTLTGETERNVIRIYYESRKTQQLRTCVFRDYLEGNLYREETLDADENELKAIVDREQTEYFGYTFIRSEKAVDGNSITVCNYYEKQATDAPPEFEPFGGSPCLSVKLEAVMSGMKKPTYQIVGEEIKFTAKISNTGNIAVEHIQINREIRNEIRCDCTATFELEFGLKPGEIYEYHYSHIVDHKDIRQKQIDSIVSVTGNAEQSNEQVESEAQITVYYQSAKRRSHSVWLAVLGVAIVGVSLKLLLPIVVPIEKTNKLTYNSLEEVIATQEPEASLKAELTFEKVDYSFEIRTDSEGIEYVEITGLNKQTVVDPVIPEQINGLPVKKIGDNAFEGRKDMTGSLTIPNSITSIGNYAFSGCSGLTGSLTIPNGMTNIGNYAFCGCDGLTGSLIIPDSVNSIGSYAFYGCSGLTGSLIIPDSVTSIGTDAFARCGDLTIPTEEKVIETNSITPVDSMLNQKITSMPTNLTNSVSQNELMKKILKRDNDYSVGNYVIFGNYPQSIYGVPLPIEWLVLAREGQKALLLSRYILDTQPYSIENEYTTWETSWMREWLNDTFIHRAFTSAEAVSILETSVDNSTSHGNEWKTEGGNNTRDKLFLLSYFEASEYFEPSNSYSNIKAIAEPTQYAIKRGVWVSASKQENNLISSWWWLRSPADRQYRAATIATDGSIGKSGVNYTSGGVRPALWVDLDIQNAYECEAYGDEQKSFEYWKQSAFRGNAESKYRLGVYFRDGNVVGTDMGEAFQLFYEAAMQNHPEAQNELGVCYLSGKGTEANAEMAIKCFMDSANQGNAAAQNNLGYCYRIGCGVNKDEKESLKWYMLAAQNGLQVAQYNVGFCYFNGVGTEIDYDEAIKWFTLAADHGLIEAKKALEICSQKKWDRNERKQ